MSYQPHLRKIRKLKRSKPSETENTVANGIYDLEMNHRTLRECLPRFHFNTAKEVTHPVTNKKAVLILYPLRFIMLVRKIQRTLVGELEKRLGGKAVLMVAQRKIVKRPSDVYKLQEVQRSRTATAVNRGILEDLIFPADIVGRRWVFRTDSSRVMKVYLDARAKNKVGQRLPMISYIFKKLTHRQVQFGYMWNPRLQQVSHKN
jgi:small subunit ribosomal protein S7e